MRVLVTRCPPLSICIQISESTIIHQFHRTDAESTIDYRKFYGQIDVDTLGLRLDEQDILRPHTAVGGLWRQTVVTKADPATLCVYDQTFSNLPRVVGYDYR